MADILMTIKPCHLHNIRTGKKRWELRRTKAKIDMLITRSKYTVVKAVAKVA